MDEGKRLIRHNFFLCSGGRWKEMPRDCYQGFEEYDELALAGENSAAVDFSVKFLERAATSFWNELDDKYQRQCSHHGEDEERRG